MVVTGFEKPVDRFVESGNKSPPPGPWAVNVPPPMRCMEPAGAGAGAGLLRRAAPVPRGRSLPAHRVQTTPGVPSRQCGRRPRSEAHLPPPARHDMTRTHIYQPRLGRHSGCLASSPEQGVARSQRGPHPGGGGGVWPASSLFPALPKGLDIICLYCWRVERELHDFSGESRFFSPSEWQLFFYPGPTSRSGAFLTDPLVQKQPVKLQ